MSAIEHQRCSSPRCSFMVSQKSPLAILVQVNVGIESIPCYGMFHIPRHGMVHGSLENVFVHTAQNNNACITTIHGSCSSKIYLFLLACSWSFYWFCSAFGKLVSLHL